MEAMTMNRYAFFYFMKNEPEKVRKAVPLHVDYWNGLDLPDYLGGPFADRTGGQTTFSASSDDEAQRLAHEDPFMTEGLIETYWVKHWIVDPH
jgi:uncharacterized protein YciI